MVALKETSCLVLMVSHNQLSRFAKDQVSKMVPCAYHESFADISGWNAKHQ